LLRYRVVAFAPAFFVRTLVDPTASLGEDNSVPSDLDSRRRAIARAFRASSRADDVATLQQTVAGLAARVEELAREVEALRRLDAARAWAPAANDEEPPAGRVSVPPITPAKLSNQAFDVLLGTVPRDVGAETRIA
jgi:hypothetical protein